MGNSSRTVLIILLCGSLVVPAVLSIPECRAETYRIRPGSWKESDKYGSYANPEYGYDKALNDTTTHTDIDIDAQFSPKKESIVYSFNLDTNNGMAKLYYTSAISIGTGCCGNGAVSISFWIWDSSNWREVEAWRSDRSLGKHELRVSSEHIAANGMIKVKFEVIAAVTSGTPTELDLYDLFVAVSRAPSNTAPTIKITAPIGGEVWSGTKTIAWDAADNEDHAGELKIDLKYIADGDNWMSISSEEVNDGSYDWDTTIVPDGTTYRIKAVVTDTGLLTGKAVSDIFTVDNIPDNTAPTITIISPEGGENWTGMNEIKWSATDKEDPESSLAIEIKYKSDSIDWTNIAVREENDGKYNWNTSTVLDGTGYRIKVIVKDVGKLSARDISGEFKISNDVTLDTDGDGHPDDADEFPDDPNEWTDNDRDGIGDNADEDDDNDGFLDVWEEILGTDPLDNTSTPADTDGDGIPDGDNSNREAWMDTDDDNDGVPDGSDVFPLDSEEWSDTDGDGIGGNADEDDDNDGFLDVWEEILGTDPLDNTSTPADTDGDGIPDGDNSNREAWMDTDDDNDGLKDLEEEDLGTDSRSGDTDGDGRNDYLDEYPLDATKWEKFEEKERGGDTGLIAVVVTAFLLFIAGAAILMIRKRKPGNVKDGEQGRSAEEREL